MVHKFSETMTDVGAGVGGFTEGLYPVATLPILFGVADMSEDVMEGVGKRVAGKKSKKKRKSKSKSKKKSGKKKKKKK